MEVAFFACCAYAVVETFALIIAGIRGKNVGGRVIVYLVVLLVAVILGVLLLSQRTALVT